MLTSDAVPARGFKLAVAASLFFVFTIWGSTYFAIRVALESFPPLLLAASRFLVAGALFYGGLRLKGVPAPTGREWGAAAIVGGLLFGMGNGAVALGEQRIGSGVASVLVATMPLWAVLFATLWGERPTRGEVIALVLGLVGVVVLNAGGDFFGRGLSTLALLVAPIAWALGSVWGKRLPLAAGLMGTATPMLVAGVELFVVGLLAGERLPHAPSAHALEALAYLIVFGSFVGFSAYMFLLRNTRPATATAYAYVNPLVAIVLGAVIGGERIGTATIVGASVIVAAVVVLTVTRRNGAKPATAPAAEAAAPCATAQEP